MSYSPIQHLVRLQGKCKLTKNKRYLNIHKFLLFIYFQNSDVVVISGFLVADSLKRKSHKTIDVIVSTESVFVHFAFGREKLQPGSPSPPPPTLLPPKFSDIRFLT